MRLRERLHHHPRLLVITAVPAERDAIASGLGLGGAEDDSAPLVVHAGGVGAAAAAASAARRLVIAERLGRPFAVVVSAGVAGGFPGRADPGATVLASHSVAADLGADSPDGLLSLDQLGLGSSTVETDADLLAVLRRALPAAFVGEILTVSTVTGTAERGDRLGRRHPRALAEAMEGYGVGIAAGQAGVPFGELRTISNHVGPRDRESWRLGEAIAALGVASKALSRLINPG